VCWLRCVRPPFRRFGKHQSHETSCRRRRSRLCGIRIRTSIQKAMGEQQGPRPSMITAYTPLRKQEEQKAPKVKEEQKKKKKKEKSQYPNKNSGPVQFRSRYNQSVNPNKRPVDPSIQSTQPIHPSIQLISQSSPLNPIPHSISSTQSSPNAPLNLRNHLLNPLLLRPLATRRPSLLSSRSPSLTGCLLLLALLVLGCITSGAEASVHFFALGAGAAGDATASAWVGSCCA
jgi:hypothetical protein